MEFIAAIVATLMVAATPVLLAAIGELVVEKAGVLNLGVEGMMIVGAVAGFAIAIETGSPLLGFLMAALAGGLLASIFAFLTLYLLSNQVATGLSLTLFGLGLAAMLGNSYVGIRPPPTPELNFGWLAEVPVLGTVVFAHDFMVYFAVLLIAAVWYLLAKTRLGMVVRAVGENHHAAHALGYSVVLIRFAAILFGGACAGLGGAYLSLVRVPQWTEGMTAGAGWIALAIVVFASWRPWRVVLGAYLFGGITIMQLHLQTLGIGLSAAYLSMAPYVATILVLVLMSVNQKQGTTRAPASLGQTFHKTM